MFMDMEMNTNPTTRTTEEDMVATWDLDPHTAQTIADFAESMGYDEAYIPFFLPGKEYGIWTIGQSIEVAPIPFLDVDGNGAHRDQASSFAKGMAAGREGTWGYFYVRVGVDHEAATPAFEDILSYR